MPNYIDADKLKLEFPIRRNNYDEEHGDVHFINGIETVFEYIDNMPAADVEEVRHGEWTLIHVDSNAGYGQVYYQHKDCSTRLFEFPDNYCPVCGAKMDGGKDNGEIH